MNVIKVDDNAKLCPLLALTPNQIVDDSGQPGISCIKERCAWWIHETCALCRIAEKLE